MFCMYSKLKVADVFQGHFISQDCRKSFDRFVNVNEKKLFCGVCLFVLGMANTGRDVPEHTCEDTCCHQFRFFPKEINE